MNPYVMLIYSNEKSFTKNDYIHRKQVISGKF